MSTIDFIGIGAQKAGTSWIYSCLYEHPQVCAPQKEIHFFSRPRFEKGYAWYESQFSSCRGENIKGEFSTSYLYSSDAPERIKAQYPQVKLIAVLRNPIDRAYSHYKNAIKAGEIGEEMSFDVFTRTEESVIAQGMYAKQLASYFSTFPHEQILVLLYEDIQKDPEAFMKRIYSFLGIENTFQATMLYREVNIARTPKVVQVDRVTHHVAEFLRRIGLHTLVHMIKVSGITDVVRSFNTKHEIKTQGLTIEQRNTLGALFVDDLTELSRMLGRDMCSYWHI